MASETRDYHVNHRDFFHRQVYRVVEKKDGVKKDFHGDIMDYDTVRRKWKVVYADDSVPSELLPAPEWLAVNDILESLVKEQE